MVRSGSGAGCEDGAYDGVASLMIDEVKRAQTADKKIMLQRCSSDGKCDEAVSVKASDIVVAADGKVYMHNHGILNDENAALGGAREMNSSQANSQGVYVVINPHTGNALTELIYAGYDKLNEVLGGIMPVSNATLATVDIRKRAAELGASVDSSAHSRGTLTEVLATQYQLRTGQENLNISSQFFYGGAANAQRAADQLSKATNGQGQLYQSTHTSDPVGTLIGGNEPTGGVPFSNPITGHTQYGPNFGVHNDEEENADRQEKLNSTWGQTSRDAVLVPPSILSTEQSTTQGVNQ
jgi:filamentous hemagglutinin